jgi:hypothetical protein
MRGTYRILHKSSKFVNLKSSGETTKLFCIYEMQIWRIPGLLIEYNPQHKLPWIQIVRLIG